MKRGTSIVVYLALIVLAVIAADAWRRTRHIPGSELAMVLRDLREDVNGLREQVDKLEQQWLEQQSTLVKLETAVNLQRAGAQWPIDFKAVRDEARRALEAQESMPTPATQAVKAISQTSDEQLDTLMQQLTEKVMPAAATTQPAAAAAPKPAAAKPAPAPKSVVAEPAPAPKPVAAEPAPAPKPVVAEPAPAPKPVAAEPAPAPKPVVAEPAAVAKPVVAEPAPAAKPVATEPAPAAKPEATAAQEATQVRPAAVTSTAPRTSDQQPAAPPAPAPEVRAEPELPAIPVSEMKKLPEGQRTTLVFSSTPSGTVARATVREQRAADVLPEEIAEVEIDGERVFKEEDLAAIATAAEQRVETEAEKPAAEATEPTAAEAVPAPAPTPAPVTPAPAPAPAVVRAPGPRRPMVDAEPGLPGATPAARAPVRRQSTVRVIGTPDARQATEPVPEAVAPPVTAAAPAPRTQRATPTPPPLPTPSMAAEVELAPEAPPARIRATPRRVTTAPSLEGRPLTSEQPARLSRLGRNGAGADVAQFSLNLSEQVVVSRPQGKVTMSDILDAAEQQEGETPQDR